MKSYYAEKIALKFWKRVEDHSWPGLLDMFPKIRISYRLVLIPPKPPQVIPIGHHNSTPTKWLVPDLTTPSYPNFSAPRIFRTSNLMIT